MTESLIKRGIVSCLVMLGAVCGISAQQPGGGRQGGAQPPPPALFFRETWNEIPSGEEHPVSQEPVATASLELKLYGSGAKDVQLAGNVAADNVRLFTGVCSSPVAVALRDTGNYVDLRGRAKIRWVVRTSGFHVV